MNTTTVQAKKNNVIVIILGLCAALLVASVLTNISLTIGLSDRAAFFALVIIGMTMCAQNGIGRAPIYGWRHPVSLAGCILGTTGLLLAGGVLLQLFPPGISAERMAVTAVTLLMLVKIGVAGFYPRQA